MASESRICSFKEKENKKYFAVFIIFPIVGDGFALKNSLMQDKDNVAPVSIKFKFGNKNTF